MDGDSGDTEDDEGLAEGETDLTVKAKEVLRKGPIWGLRGNVEISKYRLFAPLSIVHTS